MKQTIQSLIAAISDIPSIKYTDRDWGQLSLENPPVKFPCALIDFQSVDFSATSAPTLVADQATIVVTVADTHLVRSSALSPAQQHFQAAQPMPRDPYAILDIISRLTTILHGFTCQGHVQPLSLTNITKAYSDRSYDVYQLTFSTSFLWHKDDTTLTTTPQTITINTRHQ